MKLMNWLLKPYAERSLSVLSQRVYPDVSPCPFCGETNLNICRIHRDCYAVSCPGCACFGPYGAETKLDAVHLWNCRSDPDPSADSSVGLAD